MKRVEDIRRQQQRLARMASAQAANGGDERTARNRLARIFETATRYETNMRNSKGGRVVHSVLNPRANGTWFTRQEYMGNTAAKGSSNG